MVIKRTKKRVSRKKISRRGIARRGRTRSRVNRRGSQLRGGARPEPLLLQCGQCEFKGTVADLRQHMISGHRVQTTDPPTKIMCHHRDCKQQGKTYTKSELMEHLRQVPTHDFKNWTQRSVSSASVVQELLVVRVKIPKAAAWKPIGDMVWKMGATKVVIEGDYRKYKFDTVPYPTHADMATLCREVAEMCALAGESDVTWTVKVGTPPYDVVPTTGSAGASVRVPNITWTASGTPPTPVAAVTSTSMYSTPASMADQW